MNLQVTVTSQKPKGGSFVTYGREPEWVDYTVASITADGNALLLAGHLRALADSIEAAS
jgi:hypothetical protein